MEPFVEQQRHLTRRAFFGRPAGGVGTAALAWLLARDGLAYETPSAPSGGRTMPGLPGLPHFAPKAKRVIYLFQNGAPTHVELFDYKPRLRQFHGQPVPESYVAGRRFSTMTSSPAALAPG